MCQGPRASDWLACTGGFCEASLLQDAHNLLRPETVESLFVMWRVTGDVTYRDWGWHIFRAFERWCRLDQGGYANLDSVLKVRLEGGACWCAACQGQGLAQGLACAWRKRVHSRKQLAAVLPLPHHCKCRGSPAASCL